MAGNFLKLVVFITLSLHYVVAQGTTPSAAPSLVITPTSYSVDYGSTVLMTCVAYLGPDTEDHSSAAISWIDPAGQQLSNDSDSMVTIYTETQTQNGIVFLESIVEICSVGVAHSGQFSCRAANSIGSESFSWNISFTEEITVPQLIVSPVNQDVNLGDTVLMVCVANGFPEPEITWSRNGVLLDPTSSDLISIYAETVSEMGLNFTESILEICGVGLDDVGTFACTATSDAGTATSAPFTVGILPNSTEISLVITPSSDTVEVDSTVLLVCVAQGNPTPSISWDFEGAAITNETTNRHTVYDELVTQGDLMFIQSILEICSIELDEGGDYTCNATNGFISETNTTTITVTDSRVAPTIVVSPNVTGPFTEGDTVALACTATGRPYPTIQWYRDGLLLTNESLTTIYNEEVEQNGLLFTTSILEVCTVGADDIGTYSCVASNSAGNETFEFDVQVMLGDASVVISPVDYTIDESATMVAVCVGTGFPVPSISWSLNGFPLENNTRVSIYEEVIVESGITFVQSFLEVCSVDFMDAGLYQCTVANRLVNASSNFTLTINRIGEPPQLVVTPNASIEVDAGTTVTYVCVGYGEDEPPNIIWEFGDQLLSNDTSSLVTIYENQLMENRLVFTQSILELCSVEVENAGNYSCTANNSRGSNSSSFTLNVRPRIAPTIVVSPNVTGPFTEGDTVALACTATGRPYPTIQWYRDGLLLTNESLTMIYSEEVEQNGLLFTTSILELCSVGADDRGTYSCVAENPAGNDTSEFDVQVMLGDASVVISPVDYTIDESATMVAVCVGTGFPVPSISWSFNGSPLENNTRVSIYEEVIVESGITFVQSFLEVCSVDFMDAGLYQCTVANRLVNASSNFTLTVNTVGEPPQLVVTPNASITVDAGTTVTYVCVGYGEDEPPNIIWEFGDQLLSNDTSSLVTIYENQLMENRLVFTQSILELCSVEVENAGNYSCTANNSRGSNSSSFTLNVRSRIAPTVVISPNVIDPFTEGDTVSLVCTATGRPFANIQWYKDGTEITNGTLTSIYNEQFEGNGLLFTSSILEVCSISPGDAGAYSCVASNLAGNDSVDFEVQIRAAEATVVISPVDYTIDESATMVAVCVGTGFPVPSISWSFNGSPLENDSRVSIYEEVIVESGITFVQSFLEVCSVGSMDAGLYQCTVANRLVNASSNFTLTVNTVGEPAQIVIAPNASMEVDAGTTVTYVCVGYGEDEPPNIIWEFGDQLLSNDTSSLVTIYDSQVVENGQVFIQSILELCSVEVENAGQYSCTANNSRGSNSSMFTLNVRPRIAPTVVISPNVTDPFTEGDTVSLVCTATGRPFANIQWYKDGTEITNGTLISIYNEQFEGNGLLFTSSILEVCSVSPGDAGTYSCLASNLAGNDSVKFEVQVRAGEASVVIAPSNYTLDELTTFVAVCVGTGFPQPTISWSQNGNLLENDSRITITEGVMVESGITFVQSFLEVCSVDFTDAGLYQCTVANRIANASSYFTLTVNRVGEHPQIVIAPNASITVDAGTTVTYVCVGYGEDEPPNIIWEFGDQLLSNDTSSLVAIYDSQVVENGQVFTQSILELCSVEVENAGQYSCTANNSRGSNSSSFILNVINIASIVVAPPDNVFVRAGETIMMVCAGVGLDPELSWSTGGATIANDTDDRVTIYEEFGMQGDNRYLQSILEICSAQESDEGLYECTLTSRSISTTVNFTLSVNSTPATIVIGPADSYPIFNSSVFLTCVAVGYPLPMITWYREGERVNDPDNIQSEILEERGEQFVQSTLLVCSVQETALYNCSVSNGLSGGMVTSVTANVVVEVPVTITAHPTDSTLLVNASATFMCLAYGTAPITLTWYRVDSGAAPTRIDNDVSNSQTGSTEVTVTSTLTLPIIGTADDGAMFYCEATNNLTDAGVFTNESDSATLTVQSLPVIAAISPEVIGLINTELTIGITIENDYPVVTEAQITWYHQRDLATPLTSATDSRYVFSRAMQSLTVNQLSYADEGNYTIVVGHVTGNQTITIQVNVQAGAMIVGGPRSTAVPIDQSASFSCNVTGEPTPTILWQFGDQEIMESSKYTISTTSSSGDIIVSMLTVSALMTSDAGTYTCYAENDHLNETASAVLTVQTPPIVSAEAQQIDALLEEGFKVVFAISNDIPQVLPSDITWTFTSSLSGLEAAFDDSADPRFEFSSDMLTLTVTSASLLDDGVYAVRASNPAGYDKDSTRVIVYAAPYINSTGRDETVVAGGRVTFSCSADGVPTPSISWFKDNTFISAESGKKFELTKTTINTTGIRENINETFTSVLSVVGVAESDAGLYECSASNRRGTIDVVQPPFNLTVTPAPLPDSCDPNPCQNGGACENGPLTYICKCTDGFKGTNCDEAIVEKTQPVIEKGPQTTFVGIYSSVNLSCIVSGSPQPSIQWYKDDAPLQGQVYPSYYIQSVELNDRGVYHCVAMNSEGSVESSRAVINILGIQQYTVELFIPLAVFGVSTFSDQVVSTSRVLVNNLNEQLAGREVSGVLIFSVTPDEEDKFVTHDPDTNIVTLSLVLTVLVLPGGIFGRNIFEGETLITPEVLSEVTDVISETTSDLGFMANVTQPARLDGCANEQTLFNPPNADERTLTWAEAAIGAMATSPCPCGDLEFGREASRVCMGNFSTRGDWGEPDYSNCQFTEKIWQLCDSIQEGIATVLSLTDTPDDDHLGIAVTTRFIEQQMVPALGNETASNQLLDLIDNLLQYPDETLKNAHTEFNTSARMIATLDRLSDVYPVPTNPQRIIKDTFVIIIYDRLSPQTFNGQAVFASIDAEFATDAFQDNHISVDSSDGSPTASIALPRSLLNGRTGDHRIVFNVFLNDGFFIRRDSYITENNLQNDKLGGLAVAARIAGGVKVNDLRDSVNMTFAINPKYRTGGNTTCSFWDQSLDSNYGGWSSRGCSKISGSAENVLCRCNHLTSFGLLVDISPIPAPEPLNDSSIGRITTLGPIILLLLVLIVIFSYIISSERSTETGVFLINLCVSIFVLCVCYIVSMYTTTNTTACQVFSFLFHFTLLLSAGAIAIMALFMVHSPYTSTAKRIAFVAAITTNLLFSAVVAIISIAPNPDNYYNEEFCRPSSYPYWLGLLLVGGVEMLVTAVLFIVAAINRKRQPRRKEEDKSFWISFFGLFVVFTLFYVAWGFGLPSVHPLNLGVARAIFQVIFIIATIALGVLMILFFCLLSAEIRDAWKSRFLPGYSKKHNIGDRQIVDDNLYLTNRSAAGSSLKEAEAMKDISFTFTGNTIENPLATEYDDSRPVAMETTMESATERGPTDEGGAVGGGDGDTDSFEKLDLAVPSDDQKQSQL